MSISNSAIVRLGETVTEAFECVSIFPIESQIIRDEMQRELIRYTVRDFVCRGNSVVVDCAPQESDTAVYQRAYARIPDLLFGTV
jgi:hypothetical protein